MKKETSYRGFLDHQLWSRLKYIPKDIMWDIATTSIFTNLLIMAMPIFTRTIYDRVVPHFAVDTLWVLSFGMMLVMVFDFFFKASRSWVTYHISSKATAYIDQYAIKSLFQQKSPKDFSKVTYYLSLAHEVSQFYCTKLIPTMIDLIFCVVFFALLYALSPALMLVPLFCGVLIIVTQLILVSKLNHIRTQYQVNQKERNHNLIELTSGFSTIKNLNVFKLFYKKWHDTSHDYSEQNFKLNFANAFSNLFIQTIMTLNTVFIMIVGVYQINLNNLSAGALIAISILSARTLTPLVGIGEIIAGFPKIVHQKNAIENFLGGQTTDDVDNLYKRQLLGNMFLKNVSYEVNKNKILKECSLYVEPKEKIALIGPSGAGKTTLLNIFAMEYVPTNGNLFFDNHNSTHLNEYFTKNQIAVVEQYPYFFERSLRENLSMGRKVSDDAMISMLQQLGLYEAIFDTGLGLDLPIAAGGCNLSGGQKQVLAIIRMALRNPKIILMDEPTSMMDHGLEQKVINFLKHYLSDKTAILISHRYALLELAERVVVMKTGHIIKDGLRHDILKQLQQESKTS
jgi:ATP-binding cassette subfamily B protein/ATP-binding cassette subfamily C protein LapB